jgi:uncharacterized peroxidase-related enzyme
MAYINVPADMPGIRGLMAFRPETAEALNQLANILLRGPSTLTPGERELIATFVSARNNCFYCHSIHGAVAAEHLDGNEDLVAQVRCDPRTANVSEKMKALLAIAGKVQHSGKDVSPDDIARARDQGATDLEIHDTVLISAMFCLCNRYVDGLGTWAPSDPNFYRKRGKWIASQGYAGPPKELHTSQEA